MIDRRFQIFISSTFRDLTDERQAVLIAIQRLNHIPAGMELFPSANDAPWDVIERIISASDYYALIVGGRYGSTDEDGISFTEREYNLAVSLQIPVLAFLHADPEKLAVERSDIDTTARAKLKSFRERVQNTHHCTYWQGADELAGKVVIGLVNEIAQNPRPGWVRGNIADDRQTILSTIESVRRENDTLRTTNQQLTTALNDVERNDNICQGNDVVLVRLCYRVEAEKKVDVKTTDVSTTWHELFMTIAWDATSGATETSLRNKLAQQFGKSYYMDDHTWQTIATQFLALDLLSVRQEMRPNQSFLFGPHSFSGHSGQSETPTDIWQLTEKGRQLFAHAKAIKRSE